MNRRKFLEAVPATLLAAQASGLAMAAGDLQPIVLPEPETEGGTSVLAALKARRTIRSIKEDRLPVQVLSNLLWAAFGVNRGRGPFGQLGRTAASASNSQEIDLYVALPEGVYLYDAPAHRLTPVVAGDLRQLAGNRGRGVKAPVRIIFVADIARFAKAGGVDAGARRREAGPDDGRTGLPPAPHAELLARDAKAGHSALIPLRQDLADDLSRWLNEELEALRGAAEHKDVPLPLNLPVHEPLSSVPRNLIKSFNLDLAAGGSRTGTSAAGRSTSTPCAAPSAPTSARTVSRRAQPRRQCAILRSTSP